MTDQEKIKNQAAHIKQLEDLIEKQKHELSFVNTSNREKNLELDAMHYVWCDGGCQGGVHRYEPMNKTPLTEEIVMTAERNVIRLRTWFSSNGYRKGTYQKMSFRWHFILWLAELTWKQHLKKKK